jgi:hypothetical protein
MPMTLATQPTARSRPRLRPVTISPASSEEACRIDIVENPLHGHDPALAAAVEEELRRILRDETVGFVSVRFRVCRDDDDQFHFICKVENPPRVDTDVMAPWRWWSPLLETAAQFAASLEDGLRVRRSRLSMTAFRS